MQFSVKQGVTYSLTVSLATSVSSSFKNIECAWQKQVHLSQVASDCIDALMSKAQWTQSSLTKVLATQQTLWELQNSFQPKIQNKLGEIDVLIKQLLVTKTNTCSSDDIPPPLEDDYPAGAEGLPIEDPEDHNPPLSIKNIVPIENLYHSEEKIDLRRPISIANIRV